MATDTKYSRNGFGKEIMSKAFIILKNSNCDLLWCNIRLIANIFLSCGWNERNWKFI